MYRHNDPRFQRAVQSLQHNVEAATDATAENIYGLSQRYLNPCFASIGNCLESCVAPCLPRDEQRRRRHRTQPRGRAESSFDFYDDWEEEENDGLLGWGNSNDELDRLLAGAGGPQPGRERAMSYGTRREAPRVRRTSVVKGDVADPNIIPASHYLGFMDRLPWNLGRKALRYKPSAADLQEHPGQRKDIPTAAEQEPLIEESDEDVAMATPQKHKRVRSSTTTSGHTISSLSSRGDLFPSDDEDDAVPLDDEFATALERRTTGSGPEEGGSGRSHRAKNRSKRNSELSVHTLSSKSMQGSDRSHSAPDIADIRNIPTLSDLQAEEERVQQEEEAAVEKKRLAATRLALRRGLSYPDLESKSEGPQSPSPIKKTYIGYSTSSSLNGTPIRGDPFPAFDPSTGPTTPRDETEYFGDTSEILPSKPTTPRAKQGAFVPAALPHFSSSVD
jgi:hypothetical protein